jgi:hypothetical protein
MNPIPQRLASLTPERLRGMRRGVEKESLRVNPGNGLALTPHPAALGSALTHPHITTDYSESQLELITGVHPDVQACERELTEIHQFVYRALGDESMWVASMPCGLPADENIPIGTYGTSNVARAKSVYRMGLGHRYGRRMQTISGIHYNWSLPGSEQRRVLRPDPQLPAPFVPAAAAVRRQPGDLQELRRRPRARTESPGHQWHACTCRTPPRCAWAGWATRATRRPRWRSATTAWPVMPIRCTGP